MQDCCGGAGVYNLSEPEMSESLLADKIGKVKTTGAEILVTANPGCHMQLGAACTGNKNVGQKNEASFFCPTFLLASAYTGLQLI